MDLQRGFPLLLQQIRELFKNNFLRSPWSKRKTFLQLFASLFLIVIVSRGYDSRDARFGIDFWNVAIEGPPILFFITQFSVSSLLTSLVQDKESKLRQAMGLYNSAYWLSWLAWMGVLSILYSLLIMVCGMMFEMDTFLANGFLPVFLVLFLYQLNMVAFAFTLSSFISRSSTAKNLFPCYIFYNGVTAQMVTTFRLLYGPYFPDFFRIIWCLFPTNLLAEAVKVVADATYNSQDPARHSRRSAGCAPHDLECILTMSDIIKWFTATFSVWFLLAIYLDEIFANTPGVKKPLFFFLMPGYWTGRGGKQN